MGVKSFVCGMLVKFLNHRAAASSKLRAQNAAAAVPVWSPSRGHSTTGTQRDPGPFRATPFRVVDLRSDVVTKTGPEMIRSMAEAATEVLGEDTAVNELQKIAADMFGMEAALFVPTGTMGNLIAVMVHCRERGDEMIVGDLSHIHIYEQGGSAQLAGVHSSTVTTLPDGTFNLDQLESKIRHGYPDPHCPRSRLICLENTHNIQGGRVLPLSFLQVRALADDYGLSVHMDGARVMNAAVALDVPPSTILQHTHTVSMCYSKGLGAPMGSLLAGSKDFISRAIRCRKALGGGIWLAGILAAPGKLSLQEDMVARLVEDHHNARTFAQALLDCQPPLFAVDMAAVETNIVRFHLQDPTLSPEEFCASMAQVGEGEEAALGQGVQVLMYPFYGNFIRAVWHHGISPEDTQLAIQKMQFLASHYWKEKIRAQ